MASGRLLESALLLTALSFLCSAPAMAQCASTMELSCGVYDSCFEKYCPCEGTDDGYFLRYGKKYCERFLSSTGWSEKGRQWRDKTLLCLQERIVPHLDIVETPVCDCKAMKSLAFKTHVECYTQPSASVCALELSDFKKIYSIIDIGDDLFGDPYGRSQMRQVLQICKTDQNSTIPTPIIEIIDSIIEKLN
jgi:hypothetical protein